MRECRFYASGRSRFALELPSVDLNAQHSGRGRDLPQDGREWDIAPTSVAWLERGDIRGLLIRIRGWRARKPGNLGTLPRYDLLLAAANAARRPLPVDGKGRLIASEADAGRLQPFDGTISIASPSITFLSPTVTTVSNSANFLAAFSALTVTRATIVSPIFTGARNFSVWLT